MPMQGARRWAVAALACCSVAVGAQAQSPAPTGATTPTTTARAAPADPHAWDRLSRSQREILAPLAPYWSTIEDNRRAKWLEVAARYPAMNREEQARVQARMAEWAKMTPAERGRARLTFQESRQLSREEKQAHWEAYTTLSPEARQVLAEHGERKRAEAARPAAVGTPLGNSDPKQARVPPAAGAPLVKPVAPTVVQARPGATTVPMTKAPAPLVTRHTALPKITARPDQVDPQTLLPRRASGQAAATPPGPAAEAAAPRPAPASLPAPAAVPADSAPAPAAAPASGAGS